jgi:beta-glucosidase
MHEPESGASSCSPRYLAAAAALLLAFAVACAPARAAGRCGDPAQRPWCDTSLSPDARAGLLVGALTEQEKTALLGGDDLSGGAGTPGGTGHTGYSQGVPRVGLPDVYYSDGPLGPRQGQATAMPAPMSLAATWDAALARAAGAEIATEARDKGNDVVFAPTVNIMRTPLGGRTFEAYGEDPLLVSRMGVGWIEGAQSQGVIATVKHFAANNQEGADPTGLSGMPGSPLGVGLVGTRYLEDSVVDERTLREIYLPQFEAAVKQAHAGIVMCAYNRLNGQYACENTYLLQNVLRREWGFDGYVVADYGAAHNVVASLNDGLDFEPWPPAAYRPEEIDAALALGLVSPATIDAHVRAILRTLFAFGFFDRPAYSDDDAQIDKAAHAAVAQRVEEAGITLLRNEGVLPLSAQRVRSIAVIGKYATQFVTGGGSGDVTPFSYTAPLDAIRARAGTGVSVSYSDGSDPSAAVAAARAADVAIVFAGDYETEGSDRQCLTLECPQTAGDQDGLIQQVAAVNPRTVVVLETGGPNLTPWRDRVGALLEAWYPGERGGAAIARVLFGDVDPSGRLPATFPASEDQLPTAGDPEKYPGVNGEVKYKEGVFVGYRWYDAHGLQPAFPFGFGLSYTRFRFGDLRIARGAPGSGTPATVRATVRNVGRRTGVAVAELYLALPSPSSTVPQPPRQLKGFARVRLRPGQARRVRIALDTRAFSYWDTAAGEWRVAPGCYRVLLGPSSRELPLRGVIAQGGADCGR